MKHILYLQNVMLGLDIFANTILGGAPGDTISGRAGRAAKDNKRWGRILCYILNKINKNHCEIAIEWDRVGRHRESINIE